MRDVEVRQNEALDLSQDIVAMWQDFLNLKEEGEVSGHHPLKERYTGGLGQSESFLKATTLLVGRHFGRTVCVSAYP
jgi:hypothetical protein